MREVAASDRWVVAGNYGVARPELWPRATAIVWLNFSRGVVLRRVLLRPLDASCGARCCGTATARRSHARGRRTYEIFDAYWPYRPHDDPIAQTLNAARKHVASRTLTTLRWNNSVLLEGDVRSAIAALKAAPGADLRSSAAAI